jgi:hypothetical protein
MPESLIAILIGTSLTSLVAHLVWTGRQHPDRRSGKAGEAGAYCVWCVYRRGSVCSHPRSPVYLEECGPVCTGVQRCEVRQESYRWVAGH